MLTYGMEETTHAQIQSVSDCLIKDGESRASLPCRKIYVAILSGPSLQNDFVGSREFDQRCHCLSVGYSP